MSNLRHLAERMMADPVAVSHDPAVAERFRYDHLLLTGPERVWVTAVIRSRLSWVSGPLRRTMPGLEGRCCTPGGIAARYLRSIR